MGDSYVNDIPPEYLWCRDMAHAWEPDSLIAREVFNRQTERWEVWRTVRCFNCGGHKTQKLTKAFQLLRTSYDYPPHYTMTGSGGYRVTAADRAKIRAASTAVRGGVEKTPRPRKVATRKKKTA